MSSYFTTVSCEEWQRMKDLVQDADAYVINSERETARLRSLESDRRGQFERLRQIGERAIGNAIDLITLTGRNAALNLRDSSGFSEQARELTSQVSAVRREAREAGFRIRNASDTIERIAREYNDIINGLILADSKDEVRANAILAELESMIGQIRELHPEAFMPAEYGAIEANRASIAANIQSGDYQAAIMVSQGSIIDAGRLLVQLVAISEQNSTRLSEAQDALAEIQGRIDTLSSPEGRIVISLNGEPIESEYDIDYWSQGNFSGITAEADRLEELLNGSADKPLTNEELDSIITRLSDLSLELDACDRNARNELASSIAVENMAQRLYEVLSERGFELSDSGHRDDDGRKPYALTLENGDNGSLSMVISPGSSPDRPAFFYEAFSDDEGMAAIIKDGVGAALDSEGLEQGHTEHRDDCHENTDPETFIHRVSEEAERIRVQRQNAGKKPERIA